MFRSIVLWWALRVTVKADGLRLASGAVQSQRCAGPGRCGDAPDDVKAL